MADQAEAAAMDNYVHTSQNTTLDNELCSKCIKLQLASMSESETKPVDMGFLTQYSSSTCPFCTIIWEAICKHWGSASPLDDIVVRPRLYNQSKSWGAFQKYDDRHCIYRTVLAISQQPPRFQLRRRTLVTDRDDRFILTELELSATTESDGSNLTHLRRPIKPRLDLSLLRRWLKVCKDHDHALGTDSDLFHEGFRLIDVLEAKLVEKTEPCEYIALSYVWGENDPFGLRTTKRNLERLRQPFALRESTRSVGKRIPRTILDAMELCEAVGQRYLWVDCLCIVQDDLEEKTRLIHGMGHVYENANLTFFAVSGQDADAGLAGISAREVLPYEKRRVIKTQANILSVAMAPISLGEQLQNSYWNTRGWTYQEQALSERCLYFTPDEVFFYCRQSSRRECYHQDNDLKYFTMRLNAPWWGRIHKVTDEAPLVSVPSRQAHKSANNEQYAATISTYTRRHLTYSEDILNAFTGIYQRCTGEDAFQLPLVATQGIRTSSVAHSLLWFIPQSDTSTIRKRNKVRGTTLATWSWALRIAPIDFVCLSRSSFPATSLTDLYFHSDEDCCLVKEWYLTFAEGDDMKRVAIPVNQGKDSSWAKERLFKPTELLATLPTKPQLHFGESAAGTLDFIAPCITFSTHLELLSNAKLSKGGRFLMLLGSKEYNYCLIKFDSDDEDFSELVLIQYDGTYAALCVKTVDGISRRIGVAVYSARRDVWDEAKRSGILCIDWRHVRLQ